MSIKLRSILQDLRLMQVALRRAKAIEETCTSRRKPPMSRDRYLRLRRLQGDLSFAICKLKLKGGEYSHLEEMLRATELTILREAK